MQRALQQVVYRVQSPALSTSTRFSPLKDVVIHACEYHKIILTVEHFEEECRERGNGRGCKYCQGYMFDEYGELRERGYKVDFYGKHICDTRAIAHGLV